MYIGLNFFIWPCIFICIVACICPIRPCSKLALGQMWAWFDNEATALFGPCMAPVTYHQNGHQRNILCSPTTDQPGRLISAKPEDHIMITVNIKADCPGLLPLTCGVSRFCTRRSDIRRL